MAALDNIASELLKAANVADLNFKKTRDQAERDKAVRLRRIVENLRQLTFGASDLNGLSDVTISAPANAQVLTYNSTTTQWENQTPGSGSGIGDMSKSTYDVDNDGIVDGAETIQIIVRNSTGSTLTKGQVVYLSGATGNRPNAILSKADTETTSSKTIGIVVANIPNNSDGYVAVSGTLHDLDTSAFADGAAVWLSATTAGAYTSTIPAEPNHTVFIGYVARSHPTQGRLVILIQNGYELNELHGVLISAEANNDLLVYESSSTLWKNKSISTIFGGTPLVSVPTLAQVTTAGNTTTNAITIGALSKVLRTGNSNHDTIFKIENVDSVGGTFGFNFATYSDGGSNRLLELGGYNTTGNIFTGVWQFNSRPVFSSGIQNNYWNNFDIVHINSNAGQAIRFISLGPTGSGGTIVSFVNNGNVLIGTTTDAGYKLDVNGTARINSSLYVTDPSFTGSGRFYQAGNATTIISGGPASENITFGPSNRIFINAAQTRFPGGSVQMASTLTLGNSGNATSTNMLLMQGSITAGSALGRGIGMDTTLVAAANNDVLVGLDINPTFTNGAFTGVTNWGIRSAADFTFTARNSTITVLSPAASSNGNSLTIKAGNATTSGTGGNLLLLSGSGVGGPGSGQVIIGNDTSTYNNVILRGYTYVQSTGPNQGTAFAVFAGGQTALNIYWDNLTPFMQYGLVSSRQSRFVNSSSYSFDNNLLVGTTTDAGYKLDVNGTARVGSSTLMKGGLTINYTSPQMTTVNAGSGNKAWSWIMSGNDLQIREDGVGFPMVFKPAGNIITNQNGGNFLIGTTSDTGEKLQVNGSIKSSALTLNGPVLATGGVLSSVAGYTGLFTVPTNPPGMQTLDIQNGIIVNVL